ncbi:uncharacterized protein PGTG_16192 [Puccinia graminis f. sp. tritici CRL 75-36-700-3]|uniref:Tet-like 2OG-Fe(II) oxygenase domain-containing protein n=1 Tax=Puccinia graminis f. sp. tritici (strain CRL 75-36-700-3 / race SCCL) TaxID=418459 RepID=E3L0C5_PUCGT|nr:uncharacterized protein PGTG_16192 [Puccinia graminis f. sp. tritici CRL 75-36-700-3]EFP89904.1 hypothetical protein PGTG_16192 [Puccinia graminis f. sp. tritici CRL 75-36-700-3]
MPPEEYEEIKFLTTTLVQLGHYYNNQSNSSLLEGVMKGFGWRKGYGQDMEHFGTYTPAKVKTEEDYRKWRALLLQLPMVESIISRRFQKLAPGAFHQSVEKMKSAKIPSFASPEFDQVPSLPFASNLTATWGEFYNRAHIDNNTGQTIGGFSARDAQVRRLIQGFLNPPFKLHYLPMGTLDK